MVQVHHIFMLFSNSPFIFLASIVIISRSLIAVSARNWIFLWIAIELNMLRFIPLLINRKKFQETEAAVKYFLAQALGSRILLIRRISLWFNISIPNNIIHFILFSAIILKLGLVPCHLWYPSVIISISWLSCLILSTWQKLAPIIVLSFILYRYRTITLLIIIARINALTGGIIGINQTNLRAIIAYSSITHIGWIISLLTINKTFIIMLYFFIYSIIITPVFTLFHYKSFKQRINMRKIILHSPQIKLRLPILLLSLRGMPPLTGFAPKWMTIYLISNSLPALTIILVIGAIINIYYYLNIIFNMYLTNIIIKKNNSSYTTNKNYFITLLSVSTLSIFPTIMLII